MVIIIIGFVSGRILAFFNKEIGKILNFFSSVNLIKFSFSLVNSHQNFDIKKKNERKMLLPIWIQCQKEHTILPWQVQTFQCWMIILF
jgi:hypothetical protein